MLADPFHLGQMLNGDLDRASDFLKRRDSAERLSERGFSLEVAVEENLNMRRKPDQPRLIGKGSNDSLADPPP